LLFVFSQKNITKFIFVPTLTEFRI
jgi:hypothetical protein